MSNKRIVCGVNGNETEEGDTGEDLKESLFMQHAGLAVLRAAL